MPTEPQTGVRARLDKRPDEVSTMFDGVAARYDLTNTVLSLGSDRRWRTLVTREVDARPGERVLDLAAGTGTSTEPFADAGVRAVACDFSLGMLAVGRRRRPDMPFLAGDATRLPFADASFDAATISFGLRNVVDPDAGLAEMLRVVRPGGRLVVCEFSHPTWRPFRRVYDSYLLRALPPSRASPRPTRTPTTTWPSPSRPGRTSRRSPSASGRRAGARSPGATPASGIVALHRAVRPA